MKTFSIREMRSALGKLDEILEQEDELIVSRHGKAIARVLPIHPRLEMPSHADLRAQMPKLSPSSALIREDRDSRE